MSHTVSLDVKFKNQDAIRRTAEKMGASILGEGNHRLFSSGHTGLAIKFPNWQYPVIFDSEGKIFYDNFNGSWGSYSTLEKFQDDYAQEVIRAECEQLGWYNELNEQTGELVVHHPSGGTITIQKGGTLDASGFVGNSCEQATQRFEEALGTKLGQSFKPHINEVRINEQE